VTSTAERYGATIPDGFWRALSERGLVRDA